MAERETDGKSSLAVRFWWITLARGVIALILGVELLLQPEGVKISVVRFMSLYWLSSGALSLLWGATRAKVPELWLVTGLVEIIGGGMVLLNTWFEFFDTYTLINLFALIAFLTGTLQVISGIIIRRRHGPGWSLASFLMGVTQIALGFFVLTSPGEIPTLAIYATGAWAFIAGIGFVSVALRLRKVVNKMDQVQDSVNGSHQISGER